MKPFDLFLAFSLLVGSIFGCSALAASTGDGDGERSPVVLELFTSQGCSSCPPADKILRRLGREPDVIALSFHVDYWNRLGWTDPFSQAQWTRRQERYAVALGKDNLYTPQIVVDGRIDTVGSDVSEIVSAIDRQRSVGSQRSAATKVSASSTGGNLNYRIETTGLRTGKRYEIEVFLTESGLVTEVPLGENANRTLYHDYVVRKGESIEWENTSDGLFEGSIALDEAWNRARLSLVVLVRTKGGSIVAAAEEELVLDDL